jgi:uncharacterized protein GlcG (DUF336 family)
MVFVSGSRPPESKGKAMSLLDILLGRTPAFPLSSAPAPRPRRSLLDIEQLEVRTVMTATHALAGETLYITGGAGPDRIELILDSAAAQLVVRDAETEVGRYDAAAVSQVEISAGGGEDRLTIAPEIVLPATLAGGAGDDVLWAGGGRSHLSGGGGSDRVQGGPDADVLLGGTGHDTLIGGTGADQLDGDNGKDRLWGGPGDDTLAGGRDRDVAWGEVGADRLLGGEAADLLMGDAGNDRLSGQGGDDKLIGGPGEDALAGGPGANLLVEGSQQTQANVGAASYKTQALSPAAVNNAFAAVNNLPDTCTLTLTEAEASRLLRRAAAASGSDDAIIAIVDRAGNILGVRVEAGVSARIQNSVAARVFAIDGAVAKARTAAFFANNSGGGTPLTSRTVQFISQTTMTQREVESNPNIRDRNSTRRGPGFVAPIGIRGHFPPNVPFTPQVDLFAIEHTNRDSLVHPGRDGIKGTGDDVVLPNRFNVADADIPIPPGQRMQAPESYGLASGVMPNAQSRGLATLPGGIPIFKNSCLVGGIGVFFPGRTGFASEENSALNVNFDPTKPDRSLEVEYIAFAAVGGSAGPGASVGTLAGVPALPGFNLPFGRIDLVGITLDIFGPQGARGVKTLQRLGATLGVGNPNSGANQPLLNPGPDGKLGSGDESPDANNLRSGVLVPEGWLVSPRDGTGLTAADVRQIVAQGINEALEVRAAIRLPLDTRTRMVFAVADRNGEVLGIYRMPDSTIFSIDVAVAKARNVAYYANAGLLQRQDQVPGVPAGTAFSARTFRYLALARYPEGIDGEPPGPFSILNDGGTDPRTGLNVGPPLPASAFQSVQGFDAFNPGHNFHDPGSIANQNGIVFFPGAVPLYKDVNGDGRSELVGGLGVSGDGVDQDDVITASAAQGYQQLPSGVRRADEIFYQDVRLPYQKFNRNPRG